MASEGVNHLARVMQGRMTELDDKPPFFDFGTIQEDMSLLTDSFPRPIPPQDYVVCRSVALGAADGVLTATQAIGKNRSGAHGHGADGQHSGHLSGDGSHSHSLSGREMEHEHDVLTGEQIRGLQSGDRVLVAWVGTDATVIDIILPATILRQEG